MNDIPDHFMPGADGYHRSMAWQASERAEAGDMTPVSGRSYERPKMSTAELIERLDRLQEHQFITGWERIGRRWLVDCSVPWGPYTTREACAFVEGCNAMGAAP